MKPVIFRLTPFVIDILSRCHSVFNCHKTTHCAPWLTGEQQKWPRSIFDQVAINLWGLFFVIVLGGTFEPHESRCLITILAHLTFCLASWLTRLKPRHRRRTTAPLPPRHRTSAPPSDQFAIAEINTLTWTGGPTVVTYFRHVNSRFCRDKPLLYGHYQKVIFIRFKINFCTPLSRYFWAKSAARYKVLLLLI